VVADGCQAQGLDKLATVLDDGLNKEAPEFFSLAVDDSQLK
jgi:hypothetical protein